MKAGKWVVEMAASTDGKSAALKVVRKVAPRAARKAEKMADRKVERRVALTVDDLAALKAV